MKKGTIIFLFISALIFQSCNKNETINFNGELSHCTYSKIYLYKVTPNGTFVIDSSEITNNKFSLKDDLKHYSQVNNDPCFYKIFISQKNHILTIASVGETLHFTAQADSLVKTYQVRGSKDAQLLHQLDQQLKLFIDSVETLYSFYEKNMYNDSVKVNIEKGYNILVRNHENFLLDFIHKNNRSLVILIAFYQSYNRRIFFPEKENIPLLKEIYSSLQKEYPQNENVSYIKSRIDYYIE